MDQYDWRDSHLNRTDYSNEDWIAYTTANPPRPVAVPSWRAIGVLGLLCAAIGVAYVVAFIVLTGGR